MDSPLEWAVTGETGVREGVQTGHWLFSLFALWYERRREELDLNCLNSFQQRDSVFHQNAEAMTSLPAEPSAENRDENFPLALRCQLNPILNTWSMSFKVNIKSMNYGSNASNVAFGVATPPSVYSRGITNHNPESMCCARNSNPASKNAPRAQQITTKLLQAAQAAWCKFALSRSNLHAAVCFGNKR